MIVDFIQNVASWLSRNAMCVFAHKYRFHRIHPRCAGLDVYRCRRCGQEQNILRVKREKKKEWSK